MVDNLIKIQFMDAKFKFEKLKIWQMSMDFGEEMNSVSNGFPQHEIYNLSSQLRRASDSIALNIAEGSIGQSNPEQNRFIGYAIRFLAEVITCLHKAKRRHYFKEKKFEEYYKTSFHLMNMLLAFRKTLSD